MTTLGRSLHALFSPVVDVMPFPAGHQQRLPFITYQVIGESLDADASGNKTFRRERVQLNCYAKSYKALEALMTSITAAVRDHDVHDPNSVIRSVRTERGRDMYDEPTGRYGRQCDLIIFHHGE